MVDQDTVHVKTDQERTHACTSSVTFGPVVLVLDPSNLFPHDVQNQRHHHGKQPNQRHGDGDERDADGGRIEFGEHAGQVTR